MAQGKYSPTVFGGKFTTSENFAFNAKGKTPPVHTDDQYIEELHFGNYDKEGFDSYGYSAYGSNGTFVGAGRGVDRQGITESEYAGMTADEFSDY